MPEPKQQLTEEQKLIQEILNQNPERRKDPNRPLLVNEKGLTLTRVLKIGKGAYNTEWIDFRGETIPMRLLSMEEEDEIRLSTLSEFRDPDSIYSKIKDDYGIFERRYLARTLSRATSLNPDTGVKPFLSFKDIYSMPSTSFEGLLWHYNNLQREYNPRVGEISEEETAALIGELLDPEKKLTFIDSLSFVQMRSVILRLLDIVTNAKDNIGMFFSSEDIDKLKENISE